MRGIFTDEEWRKYKKLIIVILIVCSLAGIIAGIILNLNGEVFLHGF
jgi:hypothetical protein